MDQKRLDVSFIQVRYEVSSSHVGRFGSMALSTATTWRSTEARWANERRKLPRSSAETFGHTPLSLEEEIPWKCSRLVVGTGEGALPVMDEVKREAERRKVELLILPTEEAMKLLNQRIENTNAVLHVTC